MSSAEIDQSKPAERLQQAFERLKANQPKVLPAGTPVTQNNVAREAGYVDPSALRKSRFPVLVRQIKAYVETQEANDSSTKLNEARTRARRRSQRDELADAILQRDQAQSLLGSANRRIVELHEQVQALQGRLDEVLPPPIQLGRR